MYEEIELLEESSSWRSRDVVYRAGRWNQIVEHIPQFTTEPFRAGENLPENPHLWAVVRQPLAAFERPMAVATVSRSYRLAQHLDVATRCFEGIENAGIEAAELRCELGLTELGEWLNFRIHFPSEFDFIPKDGGPIGLRLECFNSVDGSSRLVIFLGWIRFICSNGMVVGKTHTELRAVHNKNLNIGHIPLLIRKSLNQVGEDVSRLKRWEVARITSNALKVWIDEVVARVWGKKAACRAFHICSFGHDVKITDPFSPAEPTEKPVRQLDIIPGATAPARTLFDVCQALAWVATQRKDPDQKIRWQLQIPELLSQLSTN